MALDIANNLFRFVAANISEGLILVDSDGKTILVNTPAREILGSAFSGLHPAHDEPSHDRTAITHAEASPGDAGQAAIWRLYLKDSPTPSSPNDLPLPRALRGESIHDLEVCVKSQSESQALKLCLSASPLSDGDGQIVGAICIFNAVTENQDPAYTQPDIDPVSLLPNRKLFFEHLNQAIQQARQLGSRCGIVFLDVNRFREINDSLGHKAGDRLLQEIGALLTQTIAHRGIASRIDGDEFGLVVESIENDLDLAILVEQLTQSLAAPILVNGQELFPTASIGIAVYPEDGTDAETLANHADAALSQVREEGSGHYRFYTRRMNVSMVRHFALENGLRKAIGTEQIFPFFQPQLSLVTGEIDEAEVLARWNHPQMGNVGPVEFIPIAEKSGLIEPLTEQVLTAACRHLRHWQQQGLLVRRLAVNFSAKLFGREDLARQIRRVVQQSHLQASNLLIEITESTMMKEKGHAEAIVSELKEMGFALAIDDFGTGYSSLSYLQRFQVDQVKIDQSFVSSLIDSEESRSIVKAVIAICSSLGLEAVAEGVETQEQLDLLKGMGCDKIQGFLLSKPLSANDFESFIRSRS